MRKYRVRRRFWLNRDPDWHGFMVIEVRDNTPRLDKAARKKERCWHYGPSFTLADCGKKIELDFSLDKAVDRKRSIRKINLIVDALNEFREALLAEVEVAEAMQAHNKRTPWVREQI
jgi:hypothetical protein